MDSSLGQRRYLYAETTCQEQCFHSLLVIHSSLDIGGQNWEKSEPRFSVYAGWNLSCFSYDPAHFLHLGGQKPGSAAHWRPWGILECCWCKGQLGTENVCVTSAHAVFLEEGRFVWAKAGPSWPAQELTQDSSVKWAQGGRRLLSSFLSPSQDSLEDCGAEGFILLVMSSSF